MQQMRVRAQHTYSIYGGSRAVARTGINCVAGCGWLVTELMCVRACDICVCVYASTRVFNIVTPKPFTFFIRVAAAERARAR